MPQIQPRYRQILPAPARARAQISPPQPPPGPARDPCTIHVRSVTAAGNGHNVHSTTTQSIARHSITGRSHHAPERACLGRRQRTPNGLSQCGRLELGVLHHEQFRHVKAFCLRPPQPAHRWAQRRVLVMVRELPAVREMPLTYTAVETGTSYTLCGYRTRIPVATV